MTADPDGIDMLALQSGDRTALDRIMDRWQGPLRGFLYRYTQNEHDARDLAQETFVRIYRQCSRFREGARFSTWMFQIGLNLARDQARRTARRPLSALEDALEPADGTNPQDAAEASEAVAAVRAAIAGLPPDLREAVILFEYEQKSHAEIADIIGGTPKAVETRLYRARDLLRKRLKRWLST